MTVIYAVTMLLVEIGVAGLIGFITLIVSTPALQPPRVLEATNLVAKKRSQSSSNDDGLWGHHCVLEGALLNRSLWFGRWCLGS